MNKKMTVLVVAGAFLIGGGVGSAGAGTPTVKTVVGPERIVTKTGPERIVTKEVPGPATNTVPQACLEALDFADEGFSLAGDGMTAASEGFSAVAEMDVDGLTAASTKMTSVGEDLGAVAPKYVAAKEACKS